MNFHSCQTEGVPGEWSPRDFILTFWTPSSSSSPLIDPPSLPSPTQHLPPRALLSESRGPPSAFSFFSHTQKNKGKQPSDPGVHWSERDGSCLLKRSLSIAAWRLTIGTNEAYHSLILIPFDLTHFIDSPCAPNEMLHLSPVAAVPCSYCYGDRERGAAEKYHNMEGVQLKKLTPPSLFPVHCPYLCSIYPSHAPN